MNTSLLTADGFPRSDIDVAQSTHSFLLASLRERMDEELRMEIVAQGLYVR